MRLYLGTCVKNEGPYLLEWLAHHLNIGFTDVYVFSNDNDDGSDALLEHIDKTIECFNWRPRTIAPGESPQKSAFEILSRELLNDRRNSEDYLMWLDCDEFLHLKNYGSVKDLIAKENFPDSIFINWRHFGSSGQKKYRNVLTIDRFLLSSTSTPLNRQGKSLTRLDNSLFKEVHHHRPIPVTNDYKYKYIYSSTGKSFDSVPESIAFGKRAIDIDNANVEFSECYVAHYAIRSEQEYHVKKNRGSAWDSIGKNLSRYNNHYFKIRDCNEAVCLDLSLRYSADIREKIKEFGADAWQLHKQIVSSTYKYNAGDSFNGCSEITEFENSFEARRFDVASWTFFKNASIDDINRQKIFQAWLERKFNFAIGSKSFVSEQAYVYNFKHESLSIGDSSYISAYVSITGRTSIGNNSSVNNNCSLRGPIDIGDNVRIGAYSSIIGFNHGHGDRDKPVHLQKSTFKGVWIKDNVWVGANVTILEGVVVGNNSIVAAGSVVTKNVPPYVIVAGNPAKVIKER